jgi:hypothetical protein
MLGISSSKRGQIAVDDAKSDEHSVNMSNEGGSTDVADNSLEDSHATTTATEGYGNEIIKVADKWLGNPWESIFSVNCILVDEKNILVIKENKKIFKYFESIGITPHVANFDMCYFWDSGLHCLSSDVYREGPMLDYWPNRGPNGIYHIDE